MELAIPLVAMGGLFILSKQNKENKNAEAFTQMHRNYLPNTNRPVKNFPITDRKELENTLNKYDGKKNGQNRPRKCPPKRPPGRGQKDLQKWTRKATQKGRFPEFAAGHAWDVQGTLWPRAS